MMSQSVRQWPVLWMYRIAQPPGRRGATMTVEDSMHDSPGPARQLALARKAARMVPGAFQPEPLIRFARLPLAVVSGDALLDAATVADRQREGGGAPS